MRLAVRAVIGLALGYLGMYLFCVARRLTFAWDIEWMEGGMLTHAARVLSGKPIYAPPSIDFVAFFYTPLYAYVLAALAYLTGGLSFALGRGVSVVASLATMGMLFYAGRREAGLRGGLLAVALYASLFRVCGAFYDLARADSLALSLALAASLLAYYVPSTRGAALSALLFVAAFLTKQTAALPAPMVGLFLLLVSRKRALVFAVVGVLVGASAYALLDSHYDGWLRFYTITGHQGHAFYRDNFFRDYWRDVLFLAPFLLLLPALGASYGRSSRWAALLCVVLLGVVLLQSAGGVNYGEHMYYRELLYAPQLRWLLIAPLGMFALLLAARALCRAAEPPPTLFLLLFVAGALASDLNHSTQWAYSNCFMPIATFGSLYAGITFAHLTRAAASLGARGQAATGLLVAALFVQLVALRYDPAQQVPRASDQRALAKLYQRLEAYAGPVLMPAHPMYSYLRDGTVHLHQMGVGDVAFAGGLNDFDKRLAAGEFPTVVEEAGFPLAGMEQHYERAESLDFAGDDLLSRTGFGVRPGAIWVYRGRLPGTR